MSLSSGSMTGNGNTIVSGNLITSSGNLIINPAGPSTNFSGKDVGNINVLTVHTLNSGNIFNTGAIRTPVLSTQTGNLIINPDGSSIDFSGKAITNAILPSSQNANLLADTLRFPSVAPDLLLQSNGPRNLLLTSNTGTAASFEAPSSRANVLMSTSDLIISPFGTSIDFTDKICSALTPPPLFLSAMSQPLE